MTSPWLCPTGSDQFPTAFRFNGVAAGGAYWKASGPFQHLSTTNGRNRWWFGQHNAMSQKIISHIAVVGRRAVGGGSVTCQRSHRRRL